MNLLSISKAAKLLGVHQQTLRNWDKKGLLVPARTLGNQRRYYESDLLKVFNEQSK